MLKIPLLFDADPAQHDAAVLLATLLAATRSTGSACRS